MFSPHHAAQLYANDAAYLSQTVMLDPQPEDHVLAYTAASLHTTLQFGVQTMEEATQMSDIFGKLIDHAISVNDLVNHSISVNDHHWKNVSAAAPPDTSATAHPKTHDDVASLLVRVRRAENKIEALTSELQQYQDWVRRTLIAEGNVRDQMQQELEMLRPKTLELCSSSNFTRCRSPRRRKPHTHDTSQSHKDPRADRSSGT